MGRKILVVGGGGREHALAWKLANDSQPAEIFCAPGNAGTAGVATNLDIGAEDVAALVRWARESRPDLTVVGPEAPLCAGLVDALAEHGLPTFGPTRAAARIEGSKVFAKEVMQAGGVPTAAARAFSDPDEARRYVREHGAPVVVKADGLAAGKGVFVCASVEEAEAAIETVLVAKAFGTSGECVLVEDCLQGEEASILALVDGKTVVMLASSQDHKRAFDGDQGPNTGGMGAYSPAPVVTEALWPVIREQVFGRTLTELQRRGIAYRGVLYAGIMVGPAGPQVLEFNCRFGDPETQVILPRLASDLFPALAACAEGRLDESMVQWKPECCVCVVMASGGYPDAYEKGKAIAGLEAADALEKVTVFHAGTALRGESTVTSGGRVLGVTATGALLQDALRQAYRGVDCIRFNGAHCRRDIGARALARNV